MLDIDKILEEIFEDFSEKQQKVIDERMGLKGDKRTLQAIGNDLGVTRERIRQIEAEGLKKVTPRIEEKFEEVINKVEEFLDTLGGVRRDDHFIQDVSHIANMEDKDHLDHKIRFIISTAGPAEMHPENEEVRDFWHLSEDHKEDFFDFADELENYFKNKDKEEILEDKVYIDDFNDLHLYNFIPISKKFGVSPFGDFGLREWKEIEPRVIRDKAYLVLKKQEEPLHFENIAEMISELELDEDEAHTQTVHNELIKDDRFVLVGRGMYGLKEHGYEGGTAKEVIEKLLKQNGPMTSDEVVDLVNQKKMLKDNTILLNLQNRNNFKRLEDGRYHVKEA